ncbi:hypothetical protein HanRHA438_Chr01g0040591 [Helianthus annuus]|nr:hypothetical protein HanRHA438_Chr01g0040591 [Helianthus annuus]
MEQLYPNPLQDNPQMLHRNSTSRVPVVEKKRTSLCCGWHGWFSRAQGSLVHHSWRRKSQP